jgi:uncharacterized protein (DUF169 family)
MMGFTLAKAVAEEASKIALIMGESDDAMTIPGTPNMVLVRAGSRAYSERKNSKGVFMIPVQLQTVVNGVEKQELFFVCTV